MNIENEAAFRQTEFFHRNIMSQMLHLRDLVASQDANLVPRIAAVVEHFKKLGLAIPNPAKPNFVLCVSEAKDGRFVVMHRTSTQLNTAASWDGRTKTLIVDPGSVKGDNHYLPFIICHEVFHALDPRTAQKPPNFMSSVMPVPPETDATAFESAVVNAATQGRYSALVKHTTEEIVTGKTPRISVHGYSCFPMPKRLHGILGSDKPLTLRSTGAGCITTLFLHDVNLELIRRSSLSLGEQAREQELIYARRFQVGANPNAVAIVMDSIAKW